MGDCLTIYFQLNLAMIWKFSVGRARSSFRCKWQSAMSIVGEFANSIRIINKIVNVLETKHKLKGVLKGFKDCMWCVSRNLQELEGMPMSDAAVATFKKLKNVLEETYQIIVSIQKHNSIYLMFKGTSLLEKIKEKQSLITAYMSIITMMNFANALRLNLQEQHESADNGTHAVSNSGCWMAHGVWSCQIALCNQAEFNDDLRIFKFKELKIATDDFKHYRIIGSGAFGIVYKGLVKDNSGSSTLEVAIKRAYSHPSKEDDTELKYLRQISHPNVIKLLGYCVKKDKRKWIRFRQKEANSCLLVSVYMPNGRLSDHLFSGKQEPLSWAQRIKIAIGSARALAYLHECRIIHRDVKSANILLDSDFNSKLADFGSAMDFPTYSTNIDDVIGTSCYVAPEYLTYGKVSEKIDVYAFGVTLLEVLSGLHVVHLYMKVQQLMPQEMNTNLNINLLPWKKFIISTTSDLKNLENLMDSRLDGECPLEAAHLAVQLVVSCVDDDLNNRPSMEEVVEILEQIQTIKMASTTSTSDQIISDSSDPFP